MVVGYRVVHLNYSFKNLMRIFLAPLISLSDLKSQDEHSNYASSNCSNTDVGYLKVNSCNSTFSYSTLTPRQSVKNNAARYIGILYIYILFILINNFF